MKKMLIFAFVSLMLIFSMKGNISAAEWIQTETTVVYEVYGGDDEIVIRFRDFEDVDTIPCNYDLPASSGTNIIARTLSKPDATPVKLSILNIGLDTFDSLSCLFKTYHPAGQVCVNYPVLEPSILPGSSRSHTVYTLNWSMATVKNVVWSDDGVSGIAPDLTVSP
ncbi:MAG: hypothetical protein LBQ15_08960 [Clostridium sp.]|jgi:hypothetical protein|nr:hypothetical protein [Clostridium sp.]